MPNLLSELWKSLFEIAFMSMSIVGFQTSQRENKLSLLPDFL